MAYDRADWHYGGEFPDDVSPEHGGTHIGMFLAWAIHNDLISELHRDESHDSIRAVRERRMTGCQFLMRECDEKFTDEDLDDEGNAFAESYYEDESDVSYLGDYGRVLAGDLPTLYHVEDTWENYDRIAQVIDTRFRAWKQTLGEQ